MESEIASVWAEILGVDHVSPESGFYDFGGTSLQAMRICARVERITGYEVPPETVFACDTLRDFVARVRAMGPGADR
ncbi:acyl carrier protein [Streptomyces sp. NPDC088812]|uniref:acyl carrier protein n=1 Tax=Streptomyces sp. NPDC088812 TaxID=3365905 RepID=UPI0037F5AD50